MELYIACSLDELESDKPKNFYSNYLDAGINRVPGAGVPPQVWILSDGAPSFARLTDMGDGCYFLEGSVPRNEVKPYQPAAGGGA